MNLQDLPEDILTYFLASLVSEGANQSSQAAPDLHTDLKTLFALTLTNAKLYKMSNPVLFSEIPLTAARLGWFLELFSKREELRGHVKKVVSGTNGNIKGNFSPSQAVNSCRSVLSQEMGIDVPEDPFRSDPTSLFHLARCKFLSLLKAPVSLKYFETGESEERLSFAFNSLSFGSSFDCLVSLELRSPRQGSYDYSEVIRALLLPNLENLDVRFVVPDESAERFYENSFGKIGASKVKNLVLHGALDPPTEVSDMLSILMKIPNRLEKLSLMSSRSAFSAKAVLDGLVNHRESLTDFTVLESKPLGWGIRFEKDPEPLIDLDLKSLEKLCISHNFFFGQGGNQEDLHLPDSVRILDIVYSPSETSLASLKSLVKNGALPMSIKTIRIDKAFFEPPEQDETDFDSDYSDDGDGNQVKIEYRNPVEGLKKLCLEKGLGLGVSNIDAGIWS